MGGGDHLVRRQTGLDRAETPVDQECLVGPEAMKRKLVFFGPAHDGANADLVGRAHDANGDFAPIGDEETFDGHGKFPVRAACPAQHAAILCASHHHAGRG
jgi:hypothetical protein